MKYLNISPLIVVAAALGSWRPLSAGAIARVTCRFPFGHAASVICLGDDDGCPAVDQERSATVAIYFYVLRMLADLLPTLKMSVLRDHITSQW